MADQIIVKEVGVSELPPGLRHKTELHLANQERVILCILGTDGSPDQSCLVLTDYKLILVRGSVFQVNFPSHEINREPLLIGLGQIKKAYISSFFTGMDLFVPLWIVKKKDAVYIDYGFFIGDSRTPDSLEIGFRGNEVVAKKLREAIDKAKTEAFVRVQTPASKTNFVEGIGDQLTKLAALRDKGDLTQAEFEAAKKKLLGL